MGIRNPKAGNVLIIIGFEMRTDCHVGASPLLAMTFQTRPGQPAAARLASHSVRSTSSTLRQWLGNFSRSSGAALSMI